VLVGAQAPQYITKPADTGLGYPLLTLLLTLCGLISQKIHREGLVLDGSVHKEAVSLILLQHPFKALLLETSTAC